MVRLNIELIIDVLESVILAAFAIFDSWALTLIKPNAPQWAWLVLLLGYALFFIIFSKLVYKVITKYYPEWKTLRVKRSTQKA